MAIHRTIRLSFFSTTLVVLTALSGCDKAAKPEVVTPLSSPMTLGTQVDDTVITSNVKSALMADDLVNSFDLQVETRKGEVQLTGFVNSQLQIDQASKVAWAAEGARSVKNELMIKQ